MGNSLQNYLATMKEHIEVCTSNLNDYANLLSNDQLTGKDYFAIERLLQLTIESGISLAKQLVKLKEIPVRATAYENFKTLTDLSIINPDQLKEWQSMIGLRNILVHEYLDIDRDILNTVLEKKLYLNTITFCNAIIKHLEQ